MVLCWSSHMCEQERQKQGEVDSRIFLADIYAYQLVKRDEIALYFPSYRLLLLALHCQSKFHEAAKLYKQAGHPQMVGIPCFADVNSSVLKCELTLWLSA